MNVLILMMRGIEGAGNTRFTLELEKNLIEKGCNTLILANNEKTWTRKKSHQNSIQEFNASNVNISKVTDFNPDIIIVASTQAISGFSDSGKEKLCSYLSNQRSLGKKVVYFQVDHKINSLNRNFYSEERYLRQFFDNVDLVITHSQGEDFTQKYLPKYLPDYKFKLAYHACVGLDINELSNYRKDFKDKFNQSIIFLGREAFWKGWLKLKDLHYSHLMKLGYKSVGVGFSKCIALLPHLYSDWVVGMKDVKNTCTKKDDFNFINGNFNIENVTNFMNNKSIQPFTAFGPYNRNDGLEFTSRCKFGFFGTYLGDSYDNAIENTLYELIGVGIIPIVLKQAYTIWNIENVVFKDYNPQDIGFIVYDEQNPEECIKLLNKLNSDEKLYNQYLSRAQDFINSKINDKILFNNIISEIL